MNDSLRTQALVTVDEPRAFGRVAVLLGGSSAERDISLLTGAAVHAALVERGVDAQQVDATGDFVTTLMDGGFDRVWIALHGRGGEDGKLQGLLDSLGIPYTGSGVLGSALAMDKIRTKQVLEASGLPTPRWAQIAAPDDCSEVAESLGLPLFIKPAREGSSIGMSKVDNVQDLHSAWQRAAASDSAVLAECGVDGPEYSASILKGRALPLIRIDISSSFYDYDAKYLSDATRYACPCGLEPAMEQRYQALALQAFQAVGAAGWGRVDFMVDAQRNEPLILEVNTVPGMTTHSLVPMAAAAVDIDFADLVWQVLETSFGSANRARQGGASDAA